MGQALETAQRLHHGRHGQAGGLSQGQAGQGVGCVVQAAEFEFGLPEQKGGPLGQPGFAIVAAPGEIGLRPVQGKGDRLPTRLAHAPRPLVVQVDDHGAVPGIDSFLGHSVIPHIAMPIQVVGGDVQHRRGHGPVGMQDFQLEAGEFQHIAVWHGLLQQV